MMMPKQSKAAMSDEDEIRADENQPAESNESYVAEVIDPLSH